MPVDTMLLTFNDQDVIVPLLGSLIAGSLIGFERELQGKPAGVRTHALVCFSAALMTIVGLRMSEWYAALPPNMQTITDMSRMPHAILTGIGFLGAGVIFREGTSVQGLTTAASLWLTAALGIVFGTGMMGLAVLGAGIALAVLVLFRALQFLSPPIPVLRIDFALPKDSSFDATSLGPVLAGYGLKPGPVAIRYSEVEGERSYQILARGKKTLIAVEPLLADLQKLTHGRNIALTPIEQDLWAKG